MKWSSALVCVLGTLTYVTASPTGTRDKRQIPLPGGTYDYIVIGAGSTSGATLAARIAEDPTVTVAVLEAGDGSSKFNPLTFIPGADVLGVGADPTDQQPNNDWGFVTEPQAGAANRRIHYARGKGIGGSSLKNFMIYQRPTSDSFDSWEAATRGQPGGSPGWSWRDVYPYFTKSATLTPPNTAARGAQFDTRYNPQAYPETNPVSAPLDLSFSRFVFDYASNLQGAFTELGMPNATDFNSGTLNGFDFCTSTIRASDGHRSSSQEFVDNASARTNLRVITNALAKKINFDSNKNAVSVTYTQLVGLTATTIKARREIIVSAGAFQSPQLLMVSGIGPRAQLQKFNIPVLVDLPGVGQNMQDHIFFSPGYEIDPSIYNFGKESLVLNVLVQGGSFLFNQQSSLANPVADALGWERLNSTFFDAHPEASALKSYPPLWPHVEYLAAAGLTSTFQNLFVQNFVPANLGKFYYSLLGALVAPLSRGTVTLASADTAVKPLIDPKWLTDPGDQAVAVELYRKIRRLFNTNAFKAARNNNEEFYPGYDKDTDAEILQTIQESLLTVWHAASTCAMQPREKNGVLDPYLRVYGVQRLRVVDASAFSTLPPGHPQSTCYMLAERAADLLKQARGAPITTVNRQPPRGDPGTPYEGI
ncbi:hypothetical protein OIO90_000044 [Microbotryomycetes sp. JL221]|nr:hypothetical protein OIO90_000044 [Microbotryomycetes sp. JL221]